MGLVINSWEAKIANTPVSHRRARQATTDAWCNFFVLNPAQVRTNKTTLDRLGQKKPPWTDWEKKHPGQIGFGKRYHPGRIEK